MESALAASQSQSSSLASSLAQLRLSEVLKLGRARAINHSSDPSSPPGASMNPYARPNAYREASIMTASP